jgi:uncharacterized lipoprotein YehR (DUF1307 family)
MKSAKSLVSAVLLSIVSFGIAGCGGGTPEIPAGEGGQSTASQDEIKKQMEESMKKAGAKYKGKVPGGQPGGK